MTTKKKRPGPKSLFHGKLRKKPVTLTLTPEHHRKIEKRMRELDITRADLIGLLIDKYADKVTKDYASAYAQLRDAIDALGGTLEHIRQNEPRGGTWVLTLGDNRLRVESEQAKRYPMLDDCYRLKEGVVVSKTWEDHDPKVINPFGLVRLFRELASSRISATEGDI